MHSDYMYLIKYPHKHMVTCYGSTIIIIVISMNMTVILVTHIHSRISASFSW